MSFNANTNVEIGPVNTSHYFDVVNVKKYDAIIGTPIMRQFGMKLDFGSNTIDIQGTLVPNRYRVGVPNWQLACPGGSTRVEPSRSVQQAMANQAN